MRKKITEKKELRESLVPNKQTVDYSRVWDLFEGIEEVLVPIQSYNKAFIREGNYKEIKKYSIFFKDKSERIRVGYYGKVSPLDLRYYFKIINTDSGT